MRGLQVGILHDRRIHSDGVIAPTLCPDVETHFLDVRDCVGVENQVDAGRAVRIQERRGREHLADGVECRLPRRMPKSGLRCRSGRHYVELHENVPAVRIGAERPRQIHTAVAALLPRVGQVVAVAVHCGGVDRQRVLHDVAQLRIEISNGEANLLARLLAAGHGNRRKEMRNRIVELCRIDLECIVFQALVRDGRQLGCIGFCALCRTRRRSADALQQENHSTDIDVGALHVQTRSDVRGVVEHRAGKRDGVNARMREGHGRRVYVQLERLGVAVRIPGCHVVPTRCRIGRHGKHRRAGESSGDLRAVPDDARAVETVALHDNEGVGLTRRARRAVERIDFRRARHRRQRRSERERSQESHAGGGHSIAELGADYKNRLGGFPIL